MRGISLKFTYLEKLPWWMDGKGIGSTGWYRDGQCWLVIRRICMYECMDVIVYCRGRGVLVVDFSHQQAGLTYTVLASLRRSAWRGGGCPIVRPRIVTVEMSFLHLPGLLGVGGGVVGWVSLLVVRPSASDILAYSWLIFFCSVCCCDR